MISHDDVRAIALGLPGAEERASYGGQPSWRTPSRMFTWIRDDPEALEYRTWHGKYVVAHDGARAATADQMRGRRGDIYRWTFGHNLSPLDVAHLMGDAAIGIWWIGVAGLWFLLGIALHLLARAILGRLLE